MNLKAVTCDILDGWSASTHSGIGFSVGVEPFFFHETKRAQRGESAMQGGRGCEVIASLNGRANANLAERGNEHCGRTGKLKSGQRGKSKLGRTGK